MRLFWCTDTLFSSLSSSDPGGAASIKLRLGEFDVNFNMIRCEFISCQSSNIGGSLYAENTNLTFHSLRFYLSRSTFSNDNWGGNTFYLSSCKMNLKCIEAANSWNTPQASSDSIAQSRYSSGKVENVNLSSCKDSNYGGFFAFFCEGTKINGTFLDVYDCTAWCITQVGAGGGNGDYVVLKKANFIKNHPLRNTFYQDSFRLDIQNGYFFGNDYPAIFGKVNFIDCISDSLISEGIKTQVYEATLNLEFKKNCHWSRRFTNV